MLSRMRVCLLHDHRLPHQPLLPEPARAQYLYWHQQPPRLRLLLRSAVSFSTRASTSCTPFSLSSFRCRYTCQPRTLLPLPQPASVTRGVPLPSSHLACSVPLRWHFRTNADWINLSQHCAFTSLRALLPLHDYALVSCGTCHKSCVVLARSHASTLSSGPISTPCTLRTRAHLCRRGWIICCRRRAHTANCRHRRPRSPHRLRV